MKYFVQRYAIIAVITQHKAWNVFTKFKGGFQATCQGSLEMDLLKSSIFAGALPKLAQNQ